MKQSHDSRLRRGPRPGNAFGSIRGKAMAKSKDAWAGFKPEGKLPDYAGDKLHKAWKDLHAGDGEPWPDEKRASALIKSAGKAAPKGLDAKALAGALQDAWRAF